MALREANTRITSVLDNVSQIIYAVIAGAGIVINMFIIDRFVILFVIAPFIGKFVFGKKLSGIIFKRDKDSVPFRRRMNYVNRVVYLQNYAKELRMSKIFNVLSDIYIEGYNGIVGVISKYTKKTVSIDFWQNIFTFLIIFQGVMFYSIYKALYTKTLSLSDYSVLTSAMVSVSWMLIGLSDNVLGAIQNGMYIENFRKFLSYEPKINENQDGQTPGAPNGGIELMNVWFTYKGQDKPSINNVSIRINKNEKVALVGHNGAGKSTLIKLLMRLYDPDSGCVLLNGNDVKIYNLKKYRSLFATAFQDYQMFSMSVAENILMRTPSSENDYAVVENALKNSGVYEKVMSLKNGMDTILTKEFDSEGVVLSGGEQQKIAVARAFAKDYEIAVFDEPTSALDPIAEFKLYESMMEACKDKTVVFISHRLSSAILADRIYLLENGGVAEEGTHAELMVRNGKYADMFNKQAEKYRSEYIIQE